MKKWKLPFNVVKSKSFEKHDCSIFLISVLNSCLFAAFKSTCSMHNIGSIWSVLKQSSSSPDKRSHASFFYSTVFHCKSCESHFHNCIVMVVFVSMVKLFFSMFFSKCKCLCIKAIKLFFQLYMLEVCLYCF